MKKQKALRFGAGMIGALLVFFFEWEFSMAIAPWLSLPLLMFFFRGCERWRETLPVVPVALVCRMASMHGGWDVGIGLETAFVFAVNLPLFAALYADRFFHKKLGAAFSLLLFPCVFTLFDHLITFMNLGMTFSLSYSQSSFLVLSQLSSLLGSYAVGFVVALFAPFTMLLADNLGRLRNSARPAAMAALCFVVVMLFGSFRLALARPEGQTVRIASVSVEHPEDYWATVTDEGTPRADAESKKPGLSQLRDELFRQSGQAADYGAQIIFWAEGNAPLYEDEYDAFIERAKAFALENDVWFMPAAVVFRYEKAKNDNIAIMINPSGEIVFRYEKSISWYPTDSDGKLPLIDTPYGKISTALCFELDTPQLIHQANQADILLVPSFDSEKIANFHARGACLRGIENGFSVVRQSNAGLSVAANYLGQTLAYQSFFHTAPRIMISDVPQKGTQTLYGATGEVFLWVVVASLPLMVIGAYVRRGRPSGRGGADVQDLANF